MRERRAIVIAGLVLGACASARTTTPAPDADAGIVVTRADAGIDASDDAGVTADASDGDAGDAAVCVGPTWAGEYGQGSSAQVTSLSGVAADGAGGVYLAGLFTEDVDFGDGPLHATALGSSFVAKLDGAGHAVWSRSFGGTGETQALGIGVAPDGSRVAVTGTFTATLSVGGDAGVMTAGDEDVFVAVFDGSSGAPIWARQLGGPGLDRGLGVVVAADGSIALSGAFAKSIDFGDGPHTTNATNSAAYVAKLGPTGTAIWSRAYDGLLVGANALAIDASGAVLFTGFATSVDFGAGPIATGGGSDAIVAKLDGAGNRVYSAAFGGPGDQYGYGAAVTANGSLIFTGGFEVGIAFGATALEPNGVSADAFVAAVDPDGRVLWGVQGVESSFGVSVAIAKDGLAFVLEDLKTSAGAKPRSGAALQVIGVDGAGARVPFFLTGELDSLGESTVALPSGDVMVGGSFSGGLAVCGAGALTAAAAEVRTYLIDLDATALR